MSAEESHEYQELFVSQLEKFRLHKGVSQRDMSLSLGQSEGFISKLTNPKAHNLPRMINFFYICDYFHIHPRDFFDEKIEYPSQIGSLVKDLTKLDEAQLEHIAAIVHGLIAADGNVQNQK